MGWRENREKKRTISRSKLVTIIGGRTYIDAVTGKEMEVLPKPCQTCSRNFSICKGTFDAAMTGKCAMYYPKKLRKLMIERR